MGERAGVPEAYKAEAVVLGAGAPGCGQGGQGVVSQGAGLWCVGVSGAAADRSAQRALRLVRTGGKRHQAGLFPCMGF